MSLAFDLLAFSTRHPWRTPYGTHPRLGGTWWRQSHRLTAPCAMAPKASAILNTGSEPKLPKANGFRYLQEKHEPSPLSLVQAASSPLLSWPNISALTSLLLYLPWPTVFDFTQLHISLYSTQTSHTTLTNQIEKRQKERNYQFK